MTHRLSPRSGPAASMSPQWTMPPPSSNSREYGGIGNDSLRGSDCEDGVDQHSTSSNSPRSVAKTTMTTSSHERLSRCHHGGGTGWVPPHAEARLFSSSTPPKGPPPFTACWRPAPTTEMDYRRCGVERSRIRRRPIPRPLDALTWDGVRNQGSAPGPWHDWGLGVVEDVAVVADYLSAASSLTSSFHPSDRGAHRPRNEYEEATQRMLERIQASRHWGTETPSSPAGPQNMKGAPLAVAVSQDESEGIVDGETCCFLEDAADEGIFEMDP
jgi:hypothetical protein